MKQILTYGLSLIGAIVLAQLIYVFSKLETKDALQCGATLHFKLDSLKKNYDCIYFGESSNFTFAKTDTLQNSISEFVADFAKLKIGVIQQGALHAGIFKTLIERINESSKTKKVIVTVNLRSFGVNWMQSKLETNLSRANLIYSQHPALLKKVLIEFKWYDKKEEFQRTAAIKEAYKKQVFKIPSNKYSTVRDWDGYVFHAGVKNSKGQIDRDTTALACHFIKNYAFKIDENNARLKDFVAIADYGKMKNIKVIFHILPENYERAEELIGSDLTYLMKENVETIKRTLSANALVIDNSEFLSKEHFIDLDWPTEHFDQYGRISIAKRISEKL